ncbi:hypothetical protein QLQ12_44790 [Actinoplanes sp. NEAU-A12]|uniref:Uncharacterized protein n=1 Tax=Actinoplanes sandaracinus TaxID=3045177 RepID=A0ABT6X135_9ACTN|nr:hypothetical protein [Actinoplanes sandaracinus]MDI6105721.1 hypothetical protein [Actinoplanes sandaracinus]
MIVDDLRRLETSAAPILSGDGLTDHSPEGALSAAGVPKWGVPSAFQVNL